MRLTPPPLPLTLSSFDSDPESSDEGEKDGKEQKVRRWARKEHLDPRLQRQSQVDPDPIFGGLQQNTVDLAQVFGRNRAHYSRSGQTLLSQI